MLNTDEMRDLLSSALLSTDSTMALYKICEHAVQLTGGRNSMLLQYNDRLGYMQMRAGYGADWNPELLGERVNVTDEENEGITAYVAATGESFVSADVREEPLYRTLIPGMKSEIATPILDRYSRVRAVINVESNVVEKFGQDEISTLEVMALVAGIVIDREDTRVREDALLEVGTALDVAITEQDLLKRVAEVTQSVMRVTAYSIFLWDESQQAFTLRDTVGRSALGSDVKYAPGEGCTGWVGLHGEPIRIDDPKSDPRWRGKYLEFPVDEIQSYLAVPILSGGKCFGCMRALRKRARNPHIDVRFTDDDERLLMAIAEQLGTGLEKIRSVKKLVSSERMAAWGELSARNSHMIGNRVFALAGDINELRFLLIDEPIDREKGLDVVESLQSGVRRLEEILQDFRDFVTATKLNLVKANIAEIVEFSATALIPISSPIKLDLSMDNSIEPFYFDSKKIERAISELVENSTHFMDAGRLSLAVSHADADSLAEAGLRKRKSKFAKIVIEDEGPGVEENQKRGIFDAYRTSRVKGMGLGLSIVKGIVDSHGGTIYENGTHGKGARFVMLLPIRTEPDDSAT